MKADITRSTFNKNKKYVKVNAQQGRVQVDADWNEQNDIQQYHDTTTLQDIIGKCGAPIDNAGFEITSDLKGGYNIGKGHYYVNGILCENAELVSAKKQEDLPDWSNLASSPFNIYSAAPNLKMGNGLYVVYLDVWQRHITFLEDPALREIALGGADTATRTKTVWQVKVWPVQAILQEKGKGSTIKKKALEQKPELDQEKSAPFALDKFLKWVNSSLSSGTLTVQTAPDPNKDRCSPSPEVGYNGDENRLYRVEIHSKANNKTQYKWSRENGAIASKIVKVEAGASDSEKLVTIQDTGKDDRTRLGENQWIEVTDDYHELWNIPGRIVQITSVEQTNLQNQTTFKVNDAPSGAEPLLNFNPPDSPAVATGYVTKNPRVRRWNTTQDKWTTQGVSSEGSDNTENPVRDVTAGIFKDLEDGIQIKFSSGNYMQSDYWLIPARTIIRSLEWPTHLEADGTMNSDAVPSAMEHHYCPLALVNYLSSEKAPAKKLNVIFDYRTFFSSLTEQMSLYYVSGDGQDIKQDTPQNEVPYDLKAGVAVGGIPLGNISPLSFWKPRVQFKVVNPSQGKLSGGGQTYTADVDQDGVASCSWILDGTNINQQVIARLLDFDGKEFGLPLIFNSHLPISFYYICGDGQEVTPDKSSILLQVGAKLGISQLTKYQVRFKIIHGAGTLSPDETEGKEKTVVVPLKDGVAECIWTLKANIQKRSPKELEIKYETLRNEEGYLVEASLMDETGKIETKLAPIFFNANLIEESFSANTGLVRIIFCRAALVESALVTPPIKHMLANITAPPAIILAMANTPKDGSTSDAVRFMEDYGLYNFGASAMRFKAVNCDLEAFSVQLELPSALGQAKVSTNGTLGANIENKMFVEEDVAKEYAISRGSNVMELLLRWWAIPARTQPSFDQEVTMQCCALEVTPNPLFNQNGAFSIVGTVFPRPPKDEKLTNAYITITKPDEESRTFGPLTSEADGSFTLMFNPTMKGTYTFKLDFKGQTVGGVEYAACTCVAEATVKDQRN